MKKKVMVVDDMAFMRMALRKIFESLDYEVAAEADNGKDAVELYKIHKPDLVTLDITMPVMDGIETLKQLKKIDKDVKAIMVSALGQESVVLKAIEVGAKNFILKPFDSEQVKRTVNKVLE